MEFNNLKSFIFMMKQNFLMIKNYNFTNKAFRIKIK